MNMTQLIARSTEAFSFAPKMYFVTQNFGVLRIPFKQSFYNQQLQWVAEPGDFELMIGASSKDIRLKDNFELIK